MSIVASIVFVVGSWVTSRANFFETTYNTRNAAKIFREPDWEQNDLVIWVRFFGALFFEVVMREKINMENKKKKNLIVERPLSNL